MTAYTADEHYSYRALTGLKIFIRGNARAINTLLSIEAEYRLKRRDR